MDAKNEAKRAMFVAHLRDQIGKPYIWSERDCSQIMIDAFNVAGVPINDHSSAQLAMIFESKVVPPEEVKPGCLVFYGDDKSIFHVMAVLDVWDNGYFVLVGACGGNSTTTTPTGAAKRNAFVMTQRRDYWLSARKLIVDPFK